MQPFLLHSWSKGEAPSLKSLLSLSGPSSVLTALLVNRVEDMNGGWKAVRPCAEYGCTPAERRRRSRGAAVTPLRKRGEDEREEYPYMSGHLDEEYSYVYSRKRSSKPSSGPVRPLYPPVYHRQMVLPDPVMPYQTTQVDSPACSELANLVAMQLRPEILVERIVIENRLRTMSLAAFPVLEGIGCGRSSAAKQTASSKSKSTPMLVPQHRKHQRRKPQSSLEWCPLSKQPVVGDLQPVHVDRGRQGEMGVYRNKLAGKGQWAGDGIAYTSGSVPLPVVVPTLETMEQGDHTPNRWRPNKLTSFLHPPPGHSNSRHSTTHQ